MRNTTVLIGMVLVTAALSFALHPRSAAAQPLRPAVSAVQRSPLDASPTQFHDEPNRPGLPVYMTSVYSAPYEEMDVFWVDDNGAVNVAYKAHNGPWAQPSTITSPGLAVAGTPISAVFEPLGNQLEVFWVGKDGAVYDSWKANNGAWADTVNPLRLTDPGFAVQQSGIAAVFQPFNNQLEVFVAAADEYLYTIWKANNGNWNPPLRISDAGFVSAGSGVAAVFEPLNNQLETFTVGKNGAVNVIWKQQNRPWEPWFSTTGPNVAPIGAPLSAVFEPLNNQMEVFVIGNDGTLVDIWKANNGKWNGPLAVSQAGIGLQRSQPAAVFEPLNNQMEVFFAGNDRAVYGAWKQQNKPWEQSFRLTPFDITKDRYQAYVPVTAVFEPLNNQMEVFFTGRERVVYDVWKQQNRRWEGFFNITGYNFGMVYSAAQCTKYFRAWYNGTASASPNGEGIEGQCGWAMGIEEYCAEHHAFVSEEFINGGPAGYLNCYMYSDPETPLDQIEHIARGVAQGLATAEVAFAPFAAVLVSGVACANGVLYACAVVALDIYNLAGAPGLQYVGVAADVVQVAAQVPKCIDGNFTACALIAQRAAKAGGVAIPGKDAAAIASDADQCNNGDYQACVRIGRALGDASGVPTGAAGNIATAADCLNGKDDACISLGKDAATTAGFPLKGVTKGADNATACAGGDTNACKALGKALAQAGQ